MDKLLGHNGRVCIPLFLGNELTPAPKDKRMERHNTKFSRRKTLLGTSPESKILSGGLIMISKLL